MTVKQFRTLARETENYFKIPVTMIRMTEKVHYNKAMNSVPSLDKPRKNLMVIVHYNKYDNTYTLITGWKDYMIAIRDGIKVINAVIVPDLTREDFIRSLSANYDWVQLKDIKISKCFVNSPPKNEKIHKCITEMKQAIREDRVPDYLNRKPITINKEGYLIDGYTRYIALKILLYKRAFPVRKISKEV